jgi:hypothetical protein
MGDAYQGKCEQMMDYIKKLRACIRAFQELDATHTCEKEDLMKQLEDVKQSRAETGVLPRSKNHFFLFCKYCVILHRGIMSQKELCSQKTHDQREPCID